MVEKSEWRKHIHEIIFEADTPEGKAFDVALIIAIILSVSVVIMDSVSNISISYTLFFLTMEWIFTILFTIEYILRLISVDKPGKYARSFFGVVDLLSIVPTYLSIFLVGVQALLIVRVLRLLRFFRIFKMARYVSESGVILRALKASKQKIIVFLFTIVAIIIIAGTLMYIVEGGNNGFDNIPQGMYWAVVTMTTVGYGDLAPISSFGKFLASVLMIMGYGIIAVPTGIVTVEMANQSRKKVSTQACPSCGAEGHDIDAKHCKKCGSKL